MDEIGLLEKITEKAIDDLEKTGKNILNLGKTADIYTEFTIKGNKICRTLHNKTNTNIGLYKKTWKERKLEVEIRRRLFDLELYLMYQEKEYEQKIISTFFWLKTAFRDHLEKYSKQNTDKLMEKCGSLIKIGGELAIHFFRVENHKLENETCQFIADSLLFIVESLMKNNGIYKDQISGVASIASFWELRAIYARMAIRQAKNQSLEIAG